MSREGDAWPPGSTEMARLIRARDWTATALGPIATWPERLRAIVELVLDSTIIATVALGPDRILIYNDAAAQLYGDRHPGALGRPLAATFSDSYPSVATFYDRAFAGETVTVSAQPLEVGTEGASQIFDAYLTPVRGSGGEVIGVHMAGFDITMRTVAESARAALRDIEERLRQFGQASQDVLWIRNAQTMQWEYLTPAFEAIYGLDRGSALRGDNMAGWADLILPEDRDQAVQSLKRVREGEWVTFEYRIRRPKDGEIRWLRDTDFPIRDASGRVAHIGGIGHDITAVKHAEADRVATDQRLRLALTTARMGTWDWNMVSGKVEWSDDHFRLEGYEVDEVVPSYETWVARIHPEDRPAAEAALLKARDTGARYAAEFRSLHPDGTVVWLQAIGSFFYEPTGRPIRMIGVMQDVTEARMWREHQAVLVSELQHRTRNLVGVVRAMADKTLRTSAGLPEFRARFRDRLDALGRVQGLMSRLDHDERVTFDTLIRAELAALDGLNERITLSGPSGVRLRSSMVQTLAMALHELATNAVKYGALGQLQAHLSVTWAVQREGEKKHPWLHLIWSETGVKMQPQSKIKSAGQGRELIERALPYQFGARTSYRLGPEGVHCTIAVPVSMPDPADDGSARSGQNH